MLDFSFLNDGDIIAINNSSELKTLLALFDAADIRWMGGDKRATELDLSHLRYPITYIQIFKTQDKARIAYENHHWIVESTSPIHTVSEALSLAQGGTAWK